MKDTTVLVTNVSIPPMSTVGYGTGFDEDGRIVEFMGDHRRMRGIGEALAQGEDVVILVPGWSITSILTPATEKERLS